MSLLVLWPKNGMACTSSTNCAVYELFFDFLRETARYRQLSGRIYGRFYPKQLDYAPATAESERVASKGVDARSERYEFVGFLFPTRARQQVWRILITVTKRGKQQFK